MKDHKQEQKDINKSATNTQELEILETINKKINCNLFIFTFVKVKLVA